MKLFSSLYQKMIAWSCHRHAPRYLYSLSFAESSFFPIPPDFMLAPMSLAKPEKALTYAMYTTLSSVLGALLGYVIGYYGLSLVMPYIQMLGYAQKFETVSHYFQHYGFWVMFIAGFGPIPYKIFTITAGAMKIPLLPFIIGSIIGRGGRFFLVAGLIRWQGERMEKMLMRYIDRLGWAVILAALIFSVFYYSHTGKFS